MPDIACIRVLLLSAVLMATACSDDLSSTLDAVGQRAAEPERANQLLPVNDEIIEFAAGAEPGPASLVDHPQKTALYGDLHVHTSYSFDAYAFATMSTPADAYRFAAGAAIPHPSGYDIQLDRPLDFYAVTDHAEFLGVARAAADPDTDVGQQSFAQPLHNLNEPGNTGIRSFGFRVKTFGQIRREILDDLQAGVIDAAVIEAATKNAWRDTVEAAQQHYRPGELTTFVAYEFTARSNDRGNLHRNVVFRDAARLPAMPFSSFNSQNPEGLWDWLDELRGQGIEALAIPHNSNGSNGHMFALQNWAGQALDADYAAQRRRNEPLVEVTQVKGTSETHPALSPEDEWADFEIMPYRVATTVPSEPSGSYVREAYLNGLEMQANRGLNPFRFGLVGASDTHVAGSSIDEESFFSKAGVLDGTPLLRGSVPLSFWQRWLGKLLAPKQLREVDGNTYIASSAFETWGASGLAAVWAENNSREAIYSAFRRKETFATSGPRIAVRFFAGFDYRDELMNSSDWLTTAYRNGVAMGGSLAAHAEQAPRFLVAAVADPNGAPLQRLQIVKGTVRDGSAQEQVIDIACADGLQPDPATRRCPDNGAAVDPATCTISPDKGAMQLSVQWQDPDYQAAENAFYYVRVLENPTCRWSTWEAMRAGNKPRADLPATIQERAWSSPIWIDAASGAPGL